MKRDTAYTNVGTYVSNEETGFGMVKIRPLVREDFDPSRDGWVCYKFERESNKEEIERLTQANKELSRSLKSAGNWLIISGVMNVICGVLLLLL